MNLLETYALKDALYYDSQTTDKSRYTVENGSATISYGSNGATITGRTNTVSFVKNTALTLPSEYIATFTITACGGDTGSKGTEYGGVVFDDWFTDWRSTDTSDTYKLSNTSKLSSNLSKIQANDVIKVVRESSSMKLYVNDVLQSTDNNINHTGYFKHRTYKNGSSSGRSLTVKNLMIKPL